MTSGPSSDESITKRLRSADGKPVRASTSQHHAQEAQQVQINNEMSTGLRIKRLEDLLKEYKDGMENLKKLLISHFGDT
jgi:hypothetical protein